MSLLLADASVRHQPGPADQIVMGNVLTSLGVVNSNGDANFNALVHKAADHGPKRSVSFAIATARADLTAAAALPQPRDIVDISDGFDKDNDGAPVDSEPSTPGVQRNDSKKASIADGFGDNGNSDVTENDYNYGSKVRIGGSSPLP